MRAKLSTFLTLIVMAGGAMATARAEPAMPAMGNECSILSRPVQSLTKVVNTRDRNYNCLGVAVDTLANITEVRFESHQMTIDAANRKVVAGTVQVRAFTPNELASGDGVVLDGIPGHDAVFLKGQIVPGAPTATLTIRFLHNGLTHEFRACSVTLNRRGGRWTLVDARQQTVPPLVVVKTWGLPIVGTVGIETLQGIC